MVNVQCIQTCTKYGSNTFVEGQIYKAHQTENELLITGPNNNVYPFSNHIHDTWRMPYHRYFRILSKKESKHLHTKKKGM